MKYIHVTMFSVIASVVTLALSGVAAAHVVVRPAEVATTTFQTFTVSVPNEKDITTTSVKVLVPAGVEHVTPTQKSGWNIDIESSDDVVSAITWSGGAIEKDLRDEFTFSAKTPEKQTDLKWKAYQTYSDGTVVAWDKEDGGSGHSSDNPNEGPFSVTKVVADTEVEKVTDTDSDRITSTEKNTQRALYIAIMALGIGVLSLVLATRKK